MTVCKTVRKKRFALCYGTDVHVCAVCSVCAVCLIETLVYCGQMVVWIRMPLGTEVGLGPGNIVLDEDPAPFTERGKAAPTFGPLCSGTVAHLSNC